MAEAQGGKTIAVDLAIESSAFEALEKDVMEVLQEVMGDKNLDGFKVEYEKLHQALKNSHEAEKRLVKKCRELNNDITTNASKVQAALKVAQDEQQLIMQMKKDIERAWKTVEASHEKESNMKQQIQTLRAGIAELNESIEQGSGMTSTQDSTIVELGRQRDELQTQREELVARIMQLRQENAEREGHYRTLDNERERIERDIEEYAETIKQKQKETDQHQKRRANLDSQVRELKAKLEERQAQHKQKVAKRDREMANLVRDEQALREVRNALDQCVRENEALTVRSNTLRDELADLVVINRQVHDENKQQNEKLKAKTSDIEQINLQIKKETKLRESFAKKQKELEEMRQKAEERRSAAKNELDQIERDIITLAKESELEHKNIDDLVRERDLLNTNLRRTQKAVVKFEDLMKIGENTRKNLEAEIRGYKEQALKLRKEIHKLEQERERYGIESSEATAKYLQILEEVKVREIEVTNLKRTISEGEAKLKQQQNLYEAVRSDRNLYSKNLIQSQAEIGEMKLKFKRMNRDIENLKEEITSKDQQLVREHFDSKKVEKEKDALKVEKETLQGRIGEAEQTRITQAAELVKLNGIINEGDAELQRQRKEYDNVVNERNILGTQLIRRNEELATLYEKIKIQRTTLKKCEALYKSRCDDIKKLKGTITARKHELDHLKKRVANVGELRNDVHRLDRELIVERTKVRALYEELRHPMNVHRWRKLEGSDPSAYEMIQKIQTLQKRLIAKTEEVVEKDLLIQEKEKLYVELKNILARQPGPEVAEQLAVYQQNLSEKTQQMKAMSAELLTYQSQVKEYKYDIERLNRELVEIKQGYFDKRRKESRNVVSASHQQSLGS